MQRCTA